MSRDLASSETDAYRHLSRVLFAVAVVLLPLSAWSLSFPGGAAGDRWLIVEALAFLAMVAILVLWIARLWHGTAHLRRWDSSALVGLAAPTVLLAGWIAVAGLKLPLKVRFELSQADLGELAADELIRPKAFVARDAGFYIVQEYLRMPRGTVMLVTNECGLFSTMRCGFAYSPDRQLNDVCRPYDRREFDHLAGDWYTFHWSEFSDRCD